jgi:aminobenzoyl-glutamate transport protein
MTEDVPRSRWLGVVERVGNALPDPAFLFVYLIGAVILVSLLGAGAGWSVTHPSTGEAVVVKSLLSAEELRKLLVDMPKTFSHFHPLGYVLTVMLGAGVAERTGLMAAATRRLVRGAPASLLTPVVAFAGMMANLAADAAYVVLVPLAGVLYAAVGRHPLVGILCAFAAASGGFSANLVPGQLDALLFGITEAAAVTVTPGWKANIAGNWYFMAALLFVFLPVVWWVTDRVIEPRLGPWKGETAGDMSADLTPLELRGLRWAGLAALAVAALWTSLTVVPGAPLMDTTAAPEAQLTPFYQSLVAGCLVLFLAAGWAYGAVMGTVKGHRDVVKMMSASMADLGYYLVLAFAAAHFIACFNGSNLGLLLAVNGAETIAGLGLPTPLLLAALVWFSGIVNLLIGSASAKWALLAPILVPMLMLLGVSPEMTTAAYRVGDSATNTITPLMVYFPLVLTYCQRYVPTYGLGSLVAAMIPYSALMLVVGTALTVGWTAADWPLGPSAPAGYTAAPPAAAASAAP